MQAQAESKELSAPTFPPQLIERFAPGGMQ